MRCFHPACLVIVVVSLSPLRADVVSRADGGLDVDVAIESDSLEAFAGDTTAVGAVGVTAKLGIVEGVISGPYTVDLTGATLDLGGGAVHKEAGQPGSLEGELRIDDDGVSTDFHLQLRNLGADVKVLTAPALRAELVVPAFAVDGWEETIPALADLAPKGELAVERLVYTAEPEAVVGTAELRRLVIDQGEGAPPLEVSGFIDASGQDLAMRDASAIAGGARFVVAGGVEDIFGEQDLTIRLDTPEPIESNEVFSLVDALRDAVFGALALDANLGVALAGADADRPMLERLAGDFSFQIGGDDVGGRLAGVSLLQQVFDRFGALGYAALLALPEKRGKSLDEYYSEDFEVAAGSFRIADGEARTDDLRVVHEKYRTNLRGGLNLVEMTIDMEGDLVIGPELDADLSGAETGRERTIPLARVHGPVGDPKVAVRREDVARFAALYALGEDSKLERKIDKALGEGTSDLLRDVLGGGSR